MDLYAALLVKEKKVKELEQLSQQLTEYCSSAPESWIAMAYYCYSQKKLARALCFAQKASVINSRHIDTLLIKGTLYLELKKTQEALSQFTDAFRIAPYRYESHKGLVDTYLAQHRTREAVAIASNTCKQLGQTPRTLTLYATVLVKLDPLSVDKAKSLLEKALKIDGTFLPAVYQLAEIYEKQRQYDKGLELLKKQVEILSTSRLHQLLGDFLARTNEHEKALHHFSIALHMDPSNLKAAEGTQRVEQRPETLEAPYDVEVEEMGESENEVELEDSEGEAVWSDFDYS